MKAPKIQGKYKYFCGMDVENTLQSPLQPAKDNFEAKVQPKPKMNGTQMDTRGANQRPINQNSAVSEDSSKNVKPRELDTSQPYQTRMDYSNILSVRNAKNQSLNSPINKLQAIKFDEPNQNANEEQTKDTKTQSYNDFKQNKKAEAYYPFSPKSQSNDFLQPVKVKTQREFVNPYYQSFISQQRTAEQKKHQNGKKGASRHEGKYPCEEKEKLSNTGFQEERASKVYICKMDKGEPQRQGKEAKVKLKKDNAPYLAHYYEKQPSTNAMRYFQQAPNPSHPYLPHPNKRTNLVYARSAALRVQPCPHY